MSDYDTFLSDEHYFGDGMPKGVGAKNAGFVGLMLAKEQGKTPRSYGNKYADGKKIPKKRIPKLDVNRISEPSDYLKLAYIDSYKPKSTARATAPVAPQSRDDVIVALSNQGMTTRQISAELPKYGFEASQPTVVRVLQKKKSSGSGIGKKVGGNIFTNLLSGMNTATNVLKRYKNDKDFRDKAIGAMKVGELAYNMGKDAFKGGAKEDEPTAEEAQLLQNLMRPESHNLSQRVIDVSNRLPAEGRLIREAVEAHPPDTLPSDVRGRIQTLLNARDNWANYRMYLVNAIIDEQRSLNTDLEELADNDQDVPDEDPAGGETADINRQYARVAGLKKELFKTLQVIKQIRRAIIRTLLPFNDRENPTEADTRALNMAELDPYANAYPDSGYEPGRNYIINEQEAESGDPTGSGKPILKLYTTNGKPYRGKYHIMDNGEVHTGKKHGKRSKPLTIR